MRAVRISMCAMGRCICPAFYDQEVLIQISLMGQVQAFFADIEHLILGAVNGGQVELDRNRLLLNKTEGALHLISPFTRTDSHGYKHFLHSPSHLL